MGALETVIWSLTHGVGALPRTFSQMGLQIAINEGLPRAVQAWMLVGTIWWCMCFYFSLLFIFFSVQLLSHVQIFATLWTAAHQASLSSTNSWSLLKLMSTESVMPSNYLILCLPFSCLQFFPASGSFPKSQFFASGGRSIGVSTSASFLSVNIQDWFPLGLTSLISLQSKGLSRVFCNTTVQKHQFFGTQLSLWSSSHIHTWLLEKP